MADREPEGHAPPGAAGTGLMSEDDTRAVAPGSRWRRAAGRGHVPPGRGAACERSGAEMGRPAGPDREGQEVHGDLPLGGGSVQRVVQEIGWGRGVSQARSSQG